MNSEDYETHRELRKVQELLAKILVELRRANAHSKAPVLMKGDQTHDHMPKHKPHS